MSNPNTDLGDWLIKRVLKVEAGKLATLKNLEEVGVDSVEITKQSEHKYRIDFKTIGTYEDFHGDFLVGKSKF